jgi:hypothetical protein
MRYGLLSLQQHDHPERQQEKPARRDIDIAG